VTPSQTQRLIAFLADPESYSHRPSQVTLIQTHASWVFVASPFVYKVKKPVNFGFLDFSTLELRKADCEREVELNRRLAGEIYLDVEPIREHGGKLQFGERGVVIEWVVRMREMDSRQFLSHLIPEGKLDFKDMDRLIDCLHQFYLTQPPLSHEETAAAGTRTRKSVHDNFAIVQPFLGNGISRPTLETIECFASTFEAGHESLFAARIAQGWFRDCHGDLHLEHIHLTPARVNIYDCIEFNKAFRHIDVASDISFLAMDLDFNDRPDFARYLVDRFATLVHDDGMRLLMDYYKCYRACVRGKVECLRSASETVSREERHASLAQALRYFQLALRYAIAGSEPRMFVFMGRIASGKSALARALAAETGWTVLSSDIIRKNLADVPEHYRGTPEERARLYSPEMSMRTYDALFTRGIEVLRQGRNVILDATFSQRASRDELRQILRREGFACAWIEGVVSDDVALERLRQREENPGASDARVEDFATLNGSYEPPREFVESEVLTVCTDGDVENSVRSLLGSLAKAQASSTPVFQE
jgi:aminoglycoside phosphotransferase family enzyme/predicted kinase